MKKRIYQSFWLTAVFIAVLAAGMTGAASAFLPGDADGNGKVDIFDALAIAEYDAGLRDELPGLSAADVDGSKSTDMFDALRIAKYNAGLIDRLTLSIYDGTETVFPLIRGGANQFLLPVQIGNQTFDLLVDTGSNALLVFGDKIDASNTKVRRSRTPVNITDTAVSKSYSSGKRSGVLATAPVRIGAYYAEAMRIMVIQSPDSQNDPSLTAKKADGVIGLRRTEGLTVNADPVYLDPPLSALTPSVGMFELDLPPAGEARLSFGRMPVLDYAKSSYVFRAKTLSIYDAANPVAQSYSDLQIPFRAKSSFGEAAEADLDILLDTGAVSKLVLDTGVAESLGYDPASGTWKIPADETIELNFIGPGETVTLMPKFRVAEISVAPYRTMGVEFEAVLGISRWQEYVVGFSYIDFQDGGPDGTVSMLRRLDMEDARMEELPAPVSNYAELSDLNSEGDDKFPSADDTGNTVVFQSDRGTGKGGWDVYVWQKGKRIVEFPNLNSAGDDSDPHITGDGRYIVFHSDRGGDYDIYLYDLDEKQFTDTPGLNSGGLERNPAISQDGRYIVFRSDRDGSTGYSDIYMYDREESRLVNLPGLNNTYEQYDPSVNADGSLIAFNRYEWTGDDDSAGQSDNFIYNVRDGRLLTLSGYSDINTPYEETSPAISADGEYLAYQTSSRNPVMGLADRNIMIYSIKTGHAETMPGLNTGSDEGGPCFTGNREFLLFHAQRPGGAGGSDIYMYRLSGVSSDKPQVLPDEEIPLTPTGDGRFTVPVNVGGQTLNLIADSELSALVLFKDKVSSSVYTENGEAVHIRLPGGVLDGTSGTADIAVGNRSAQNMKIVLTENQTAYNSLSDQGITAADGVLGLRYKRASGDTGRNLADSPLAVLYPPVSMTEYDFSPDDGAGITLGRMPVIGAASPGTVFSTFVEGVTDADDPIGGSFTDMEIPFAIENDKGGRILPEQGILLSTVLQNELVLDAELAERLGYSPAAGWGDVQTVNIRLTGQDTFLSMGRYSADSIRVEDLGDTDYAAVLSLERWNRLITGFDVVDFQNGGPVGVVSLVNRNSVSLAEIQTGSDRHFVSLPGLNSIGDDQFGDMSDDGKTIVFQSNREGGAGGLDIYVYRTDQGILDIPGLNSPGEDGDPSISGDGNLIAFHSDRDGSSDIYLYDMRTRMFAELPGLNTEYTERNPELSGDGTRLAFRSERPDNRGGSDIYLYSITEKALIPLRGSWLNTEADEYDPSLNTDGTLISFDGWNRNDEQGSGDVYLYGMQSGGLRELPRRINSEFFEAATALSPDGNFMAFYSERNTPELVNRGRDIFLADLSSGEFLFLPGLNTDFEESGPALSPNAEYILFHAKRGNGEGGYDIYLYKRDREDKTPYTASETYTEDGYVSGADGNAVANAAVNAVDREGNIVASATAGTDGRFTIDIPAGTSLPVKYETPSADATVTTDEVGDDTYVPDFEAGNIRFTNVWVEDTAQAGFPTNIHFDAETDVRKYNVYVNLGLKRLNPGENPWDIDPGAPEFKVDHEITGLVIKDLGQPGKITEPVVSTQGDIVTTVTYSGESNRKAHVEHSFVMPDIQDGIYAAIFTINKYDVSGADDALQGELEGDLADNFDVAPASIIIGRPDKPNLRILFAELNNYSFETGDKMPDDTSDLLPQRSDFRLNMEVESMAQDTTSPVDIIFELEADGVRYPLWTSGSDEEGNEIKKEKWTYPVECLDSDGSPGQEGEPDITCASLKRQHKRGRTYDLYLNETLYNLLTSVTEDKNCTLIITVDPDNSVQEWENSIADNVMEFPVIFLAQRSETRAKTPRTQYPNAIFDKYAEDWWGNNNIGAGYRAGGELSYNKNWANVPYAADFIAGASLRVDIFGFQFIPIVLSAVLKFDVDDLPGSGFIYRFYIFEVTIWEYLRYGLSCDDTECDIWNTQDDDGNEKYSKSKKGTKSATFSVGPVPVTVTGGFAGEIGIKAALKIGENNRAIFEGGPYGNLTGIVEGGLGVIGCSAGFGINLKIIEVFPKFATEVQFKPSVPSASITFKVPLELSSLDGNFYLYAQCLLVRHEHTIIEWDGISREYNFLVDPITYTYPSPSSKDIWGLDANGLIFKWNGSSWVQVSGALKQLSVGSDGVVWGVNSINLVYMRAPGDTRWTQIPQKNLVYVAVGNADNVWGLDSNGLIFKWNGSSWVQVSGALKQLSVASDGTLWGVNSINSVYKRSPGDTSWTHMPQKSLVHVEISK